MNDWVRLTPEGEHPGEPVCVEHIPPYPGHWWRYELSHKFLSAGEALAFALQVPEVRALVEVARAQAQTLANLGNAFLDGDGRIIALNAATNVRAALAAIEGSE